MQFWEILISALISALTIVASVWLARRTTSNEINREVKRMRTAQRGDLLMTFASLGAELIKSFANKSYTPGHVILFSAGMYAKSGPEEAETREWMRDVIAEVQAAGREGVMTVTAIPVGQRTAERVDAAWKLGAKNAARVFESRVDELENWPWTDLPWNEYLLSVESAPVVPWKKHREKMAEEGDLPTA